MKRNIVLAVLAWGLTACGVLPFVGPVIEGDGVVQREKRQLADFDRIELPISAEIHVRQGKVQDVEIEAEGNILDYLKSTVNNGTLRFTFNDVSVRNIKPIRIWLTTPNINRLSVSGSGKIYSDNVLIGKDLTLQLSGSGLIDVAVDLDNDLYTYLSGSGNIYVEGDANSADYQLSGSGIIEAFDLYANNVDANISGSGRCETTCKNRLGVNISGSGEVYFRGSPNVSKRISGSGRIVNAN